MHILARHFPHYIMLYLYFPENIPIISDVPRNSRYMLRGASSSKTLAVWLAKICVTLGSLLQMGDLVHQTIGNQLYFYKLGILHRHDCHREVNDNEGVATTVYRRLAMLNVPVNVQHIPITSSLNPNPAQSCTIPINPYRTTYH